MTDSIEQRWAELKAMFAAMHGGFPADPHFARFLFYAGATFVRGALGRMQAPGVTPDRAREILRSIDADLAAHMIEVAREVTDGPPPALVTDPSPGAIEMSEEVPKSD